MLHVQHLHAQSTRSVVMSRLDTRREHAVLYYFTHRTWPSPASGRSRRRWPCPARTAVATVAAVADAAAAATVADSDVVYGAGGGTVVGAGAGADVGGDGGVAAGGVVGPRRPADWCNRPAGWRNRPQRPAASTAT